MQTLADINTQTHDAFHPEVPDAIHQHHSRIPKSPTSPVIEAPSPRLEAPPSFANEKLSSLRGGEIRLIS
eukprot:1193340-Prorocentrum_minimum.AAC.4